MSATDPVLAPDRGSEQAVYSSSISGPRPDEVAHIRELVDAAPPVPDPWEGVPAAEPIEGFDLEAQWQAIVGSPVPDISEVRSVRAVMVHGVARVEPLGPSSWMVTIGAFAEFVFREVATHRDLSADVTISTGGIHMLRTTSTLSLHGRTALARAAIARAGGVGGSEMWEDAVDQAVE
ncbi:MAG: hypothetical protein LH650_04580, partial [Chloroflexi bacterium]|nr:hypothetical protein [Chloroflexota bacterium]